MTRSLATIREIAEVRPHPNADRLDLIRVDGWTCVTGKGNFKEGDKAVYFEIDSFLPMSDERFRFLEKNAITFNGTFGARIRTIRLRGELSQGLCLPLSDFPEITDEEDVTDLLGICKLEPKLPAQLAGQVKGTFPSWIPKTDQERIQNLWGKLTNPTKRVKYVGRDEDGNAILEPDDSPNPLRAYTYEITTKLDGSSMTIYKKVDGTIGVCSRNYDLTETEDNAFWRCFRENNLEEKLMAGFAFQGELMGPGVQGNHENLDRLRFFVFDMYDLIGNFYVGPEDRRRYCESIGFDHAPVLETNRKFDFENIDEALAYAVGPSLHNPMREGVVFKSNEDPSFSFKIISNAYLERFSDR